MTHSNKTCKCQFKHFYKPSKCNAFIPTGDSEMHFIDVLAVKPLTVANQVILGKFISWCQSSLHCVMLTPWPHHLHNTAATYVNRNWSLPSHQSAGDNFLIYSFLRFYAANEDGSYYSDHYFTASVNCIVTLQCHSLKCSLPRQDVRPDLRRYSGCSPQTGS